MTKAALKKSLYVAVGATCIGALAFLFAVRVSAALRSRAEAAEAVPEQAPTVQVEPLTRHELSQAVSFTGTIRASNRLDLFPKVSGRVEQVAVQVGDQVKVGQTLATVEHRELQFQTNQAQAQIQAASATVDQAQLRMEAAQRQFERYRVLRDQGTVSQAEFEQMESNFRTAEAALNAARAQLGVTRAAASLAAEALVNSRIKSPIAGTVTKSAVEIGTQVSPSQSVFEIQDVSSLKLAGAVTAPDFARLRVGQEARLTVDSLPGQVFLGRIATLSPSLDPNTRRAAVEVVIENHDARLLPNMFATAHVTVGVESQVLALPQRALVPTPSGPVVFVVRGDKAVQVRPRLGPPQGQLVPVLEGLRGGESVIVSGQTNVSDQQVISLARSPSPRAASTESQP